ALRALDLLEELEAQLVFDEAEKAVHLRLVIAPERPGAHVAQKLHRVALAQKRDVGRRADLLHEVARHAQDVRAERHFVLDVRSEMLRNAPTHHRAVERIAGHRDAADRKHVAPTVVAVWIDADDREVGGAAAEVGDEHELWLGKTSAKVEGG